MAPIVVAPGGSARTVRRVTGLADSRPWWSGGHGGERRGGERFGAVVSSVDGLSRTEPIPVPLQILGVAVPEGLRRSSDARVTVTVGGAKVTTSLGPVIHRHADAVVGLQDRSVGGVPDVTLRFARGLDWLPTKKALARTLPVVVKSHLDREQVISLSVLAPNGLPKGIRGDPFVASIRLGAHEERELFVQLRGTVEGLARQPIGIVAAPLDSARDSARVTTDRLYNTGFQMVQRAYLPPIRMYGSSGEWLQPIEISAPANLTTLYVPAAPDEVVTALGQVGVFAREIVTTDQLLSVDLSKVTTIALGPGVFDAKPELLGQAARLTEFVRKGGTLVVLRGGRADALAQLLPYPVSFANPAGERVTEGDAAVRVLDAKARVLNWPNRIGAADWADWNGARALAVPTTADPRFPGIVEMHDPGQPENRNAILMARVGKGVVVYTSLTLERQIGGGVPGGLRLLVNLLSAGIAVP
jgi:hypothetical protein